jgi:hypothetical protein
MRTALTLRQRVLLPAIPVILAVPTVAALGLVWGAAQVVALVGVAVFVRRRTAMWAMRHHVRSFSLYSCMLALILFGAVAMIMRHGGERIAPAPPLLISLLLGIVITLTFWRAQLRFWTELRAKRAAADGQGHA